MNRSDSNGPGDSIRLAAIDAGSNAVRLLLSRVLHNGREQVYKKESLVRMPLRLGADVFSHGVLSEQKIDELVATMHGFSHLMRAYGALDHLACATSAMREATNGVAVVEAIRKQSGIDIEIINGQREAEIISMGRPGGWLNADEQYMFVDVGGGSTEITFFAGTQRVSSQSFEIGGIRLLQGGISGSRWQDMKNWVRTASKPYRPIVAIGSGGNINKLFRLARKKEGTRLSYRELRHLYDYLRQFTFSERITRLGLRPDRADVIIPAAQIYLRVMKWADCKAMLVPMTGLSDGLIHLLVERMSGETSRQPNRGRITASTPPGSDARP
jgi:exopolyphosphatase/guanosine-5'-triphosphate,3'-diphosphate pyrophosphatase